MKEIPILMNAQVVRNVMDGIQTQDRRPVKAPKLHADYGEPDWDSALWLPSAQKLSIPYPGNGEQDKGIHPMDPPWAVGEVLWVRETVWHFTNPDRADRFEYDADQDYDGTTVSLPGSGNMPIGLSPLGLWSVRKRPSIHMPKEACRTRLRVTRVWAERVRDISDADAVAEGVMGIKCAACAGGSLDSRLDCRIHSDPVARWSDLWVSIYGEESWGRNDWVWACEFEKIEGGA